MFNRKFYEENKIQLTSYLEVPKYFVDHKGIIRSTLKLRDEKFENLSRGIIESPYEEEFHRLYTRFDREIIIFIEDRELWNYCLLIVGYLYGEAYNKCFFILDFFDPSCSLNIEIDSIQFHSGDTSKIDKARDEYLSIKFNIHTIRIYGVTLYDNLDKVDDYLNSGKGVEFKSPCFDSTIDKLFYKQYQNEIDKLYILSRLRTFTDHFRVRGIILTKKDLKNLSINENSQLDDFTDFINKYYDHLYGLSIIQNSTEYTTEEALIELNDFTWSRWKTGQTIPQWIVGLKGQPPKEAGLRYKKIRPSKISQQRDEEFMKKLNEYGYNNMEILSKYT